MEKRIVAKAFIPVIIIFIITNSFLFFGRNWLQAKSADDEVLLWGNIILFIVSSISFVLYSNGMAHKNTHGFLRNVYGAMLLKLFVCIIAAFAYIYAVGSNVNKPALFGCMFLYLLYTFIEMRGVLRFNKEKK